MQLCSSSYIFSLLSIVLLGHKAQSQIHSLFICHKFQALKTSSFIAKTSRVHSQLACAFACSAWTSCASFNFANGEDSSGQHLCQLLPIDQTERELEESDVFHFYQRVIPDPCSSTPCQNHGTCDVTIGARDVICTCSLGFVGKFCQTDKWAKINTSPRCFGARNDTYTMFTIPRTGELVTLKLVRTSGQLTCDNTKTNGWNYWGCLDDYGKHAYMSVIITDANNNLVLPTSDKFIAVLFSKIYNSVGCSATSPELIFPKPAAPLSVVSGQKYRIWFGQDLDNQSESNNQGNVCVDVYSLFA